MMISQSEVKYRHTFEQDIFDKNKRIESLIVAKGEASNTIAFDSCVEVDIEFSFKKIEGSNVI